MPASAWPVWSLAILLPALVAGRPATAAPEPPGPRVEYRDDRLTAHIEEAPLHEVLAAMGKATGAEVRGRPLDDRPVSVALDAVPLDDALHRLLGSQNFTLSYARDGRPKTVMLLGGPEEFLPSDPDPRRSLGSALVSTPGACARPVAAGRRPRCASRPRR
jgi:hypothetical protein